MSRGIRVSAAWLGCAVGVLLHVAAAHANSRPLAQQVAIAPVAASAAPDALRVLALPTVGDAQGVGDEQARRMLEDFARALGRRLEWSNAVRPADIRQRILNDAVDVVIAPGPVPPDARTAARLVATSPVATERYVVVGRTDNRARNPLELARMSVAMALGSPHWHYFDRVQRIVPGLKLHALANELPRSAPLQLVADGMVDIAVLPVAGGLDFLADNPRIKRLFDLTTERPLSWYVRRTDPALLANLNQFIDRYHAAYFEPSVFVRDFAAIKRRGVLRIITRVEPGNYYIRDGKPSGYELELAANFAERHKLRLEVRVAHDDAQMLDWLTRGAGDLVTGRLVEAPTQGSGPGYARSRTYGYEAFATVSRRALPLRSPLELGGLVLAATEGSPAFRALTSMRARLPGTSVIAVSPTVPESLLLARVADGMVDATVVSGAVAARLRALHPELHVGTSIAHAYDYRWTVREGDEALLDAVDEFLVDAQRTGLASILAARYEAEREARTFVAGYDGRLSPYDPIVRRYADRYGFDWRLIAAQMYQESQFDPRAVSPSGARGLMQLMPRTALALGFADLARPESAIHAGVKYLYELRNEFDAGVPVGERTWFALAAYNLGPRRLQQARRYAARLKLDPNRWTGNVEAAMLRLAQPGGSAGDRRYGQALIYVRTIQSLYGSYRSQQISAAPGLGGVPRA